MKTADIGKNRNKEKLTMLMGVVSTMPILGLPIGGRYITLFTIVFALYFISATIEALSIRRLSIHITNLSKTYLLFLTWPIISYFVGVFYMPNEWHFSMRSYIVKVLAYLALTFILYINKNKNTAKAFCRGLIIGIAINALWSIFEALSWYLLNKSLNDLLFGSFINIGRDIIIKNKYGGVRVSGLNYDPAHLGGILPILWFFGLMRGNIYIVILSLISLAFSQSTTALLGFIIAFAVFIYVKKDKSLKITSNKIYMIGIILIGLSLALCVVGSNRTTRLINNISENINGYLTRINTLYVGTSNTAEPRRIYYSQAFDKLLERGPLVALFGSGLGTSMYPYRNVSGLFASGAQQTVTEIETNYIAYLFDLGVIGLTLYVVFLANGFKKYARTVKISNDASNVIFFASFISIIVCSATYHYIFTAYHMLVFSFATVYADSL